MAVFVPNTNDITPGSFGAADILTAAHNSFNTAPEFSVVAAASGGADGFVVRPVSDPIGAWRYVFRRIDTTSFALGIDSDDQVTGSGAVGAIASNDPVNTGTNWSGQVAYTVHGSIGAGSKVFLWMADDAFMLFTTNTSDSDFLNCIHGGRIYQPYFSNLYAHGRTGLGTLNGAIASTANSYTWLNASGAATVGGNQLCQIQLQYGGSGAVSGETRGNQYWARLVGFQSSVLTNTALAAGDTSGGDTAVILGTGNPVLYSPVPVSSAGRDVQGAASSVGFELGMLRYLYGMPTARTVMTRIDSDNTTDQCIMYIGSGTAALAVAWDKTVTP